MLTQNIFDIGKFFQFIQCHAQSLITFQISDNHALGIFCQKLGIGDASSQQTQTHHGDGFVFKKCLPIFHIFNFNYNPQLSIKNINKPITAKTMDKTQKRITTLVSDQPFACK